MFAFLVKLIIMIAISIAIAPKQKSPKSQAPRPIGLEQFNIPTAEEGRPIQVVFGKLRVTGPNVVWYGDFESVAIWS